MWAWSQRPNKRTDAVIRNAYSAVSGNWHGGRKVSPGGGFCPSSGLTAEGGKMENSSVYKLSFAWYFTVMFWSLLLSIVIIGIPLVIRNTIKYCTLKITLGESSVVYKIGWLNISERQIAYKNINSVDLKRDIGGRSFGYGEITIRTGNDTEGLHIRGIRNPESLKNAIQAHIA